MLSLVANQHDKKHYPEIYDIKSDSNELSNSQRDNIRDIIQPFDSDQYRLLNAYLVKRLRKHGVRVGKAFNSVVWKMGLAMIHNWPVNNPIILTARPGLGKTESLKATLIVRSLVEQDFTAIVVARRVKDLVEMRDEINNVVGENIGFVWPTFKLMTLNKSRCQNGYTSSKLYDITICKDRNCNKFDCPVKDRYTSFWPFKILFITTKSFHIALDGDNLKSLRVFKSATKQRKSYRKYLFIDENPGMIFSADITDRLLHDCTAHLKSNKFEQKLVDEFLKVKGIISQLVGGDKPYEYIETIDKSYKLSAAFKKAWRKNPHKDYYDLPERINNLVESGGIRQNGNQVVDYLIAISKYRLIHGKNLRTIILDGTGLNDLTYRSKDFNILSINDFRSYSRATIHHYPLSLSKSYYINNNNLETISKIVAEIIECAGKKETLVIAYERHESQFKQMLKPFPKIHINHFGNLIGSNEYRECTVVYFAGLIDYGPKEYFSQLTAIEGDEIDLSIVYNQKTPYGSDQAAEYCSSLMALSTYQDIMRCNLRWTGSRKKVNIYIWTKNARIADHLVEWFPKINLINESVPAALRSSRQSDEIPTDALSKLDVYEASMIEAEKTMLPKQRAEKLTSILGRVPERAEFKYIWPDIDPTHYSNRYKKYAKRFLARKRTG